MKILFAFLSLVILSSAQASSLPSLAPVSLQASKAVYALPNLRARVERESFLERFHRFYNLTPEHYEIYGADGDLSTGLKYVIYRPLPANADAPWVLAITGTETFIDWVNNADLGRPQLLLLQKIVQLFHSNLIGDHPLLITGHSLGGALAQAVAHEIQRARLEQNRPFKKIQVITWNAFGGREVIEKVSHYQEELLASMEVAHYFVRGDLVSGIGTHIGPTYELVDPLSGKEQGIKETVRLHALETIEPFATEEILRNAPLRKPPSAGVINALSKITWLMTPLQDTVHDFRQLWISRWMVQMLNQIGSEDLRNPVRREAFQYVYNIGFTESIRLRKENDRDQLRDLTELTRALDRFYQLRRIR